MGRSIVIPLLLSLLPTGCKRSSQVPQAPDAAASPSAKKDLLCVEQPRDGCLRCADARGEAPFLDPDQLRPVLCDPRDAENCFDFCSIVAAECALPWWRGQPCLKDSELDFHRALFSRETADRPETVMPGRVLDEGGKRIEGAQIRVWLSRGGVLTPLADEVSAKDGSFRLRLKQGPWSYALRLSYPGMSSEIVDRLNVEKNERQPSATPPARTFHLVAEHVIRGRVLNDADGLPVVGATVQAVRSAEDVIDSGTAQTGDDGAFVLGGLEGSKRYFVRVSKFGWRKLTASPALVAPAARITLKLSRANVIRGVVVDADGDPEPTATVMAVLSGSAAGADLLHTWTTDADGRFAEDDFEPGTYYLWARRRDRLLFPPEKIELDESQDVEVKLTLSHKGARVTGSVLSNEGAPWTGAASPVAVGTGGGRVVLLGRSPLAFPKHPVGEVDSRGHFVVSGVLPGRYEISIKSGARTMVVVPGPREIEVPVDPDSVVNLKEPMRVRPSAEE